MEGLYTNRNTESDFVQNALFSAMEGVTDVFIAVAFFTDAEVIEKMTGNGYHVRLIVRLGFPTNPKALKELASNPNVELRYFTGPLFHPKLYIFGDMLALIGSANLTYAALRHNQEVVVTIPSEDARFAELGALFTSYWHEALVLTDDGIEKYEQIDNKYSAIFADTRKAEREIENEIGSATFSNINRGVRKKSKENIFVDSYRRSYQETVTAFRKIRTVYESIGLRKAESSLIPLRLEIDAFLSFVRETYATKESWREQPLGWTSVSEGQLKDHIKEWHDTERHYFDHTIVKVNYPLISRVFSSPDSIQASDIDEIVEAVAVLHSFSDRHRFFTGSLGALKADFKKQNTLDNIKRTILHLLFGKGDIVERMCDAIYDSSYKLAQFGPSTVQELVGWINKEGLPVINGRTTKVLRFYGFDVSQS